MSSNVPLHSSSQNQLRDRISEMFLYANQFGSDFQRSIAGVRTHNRRLPVKRPTVRLNTRRTQRTRVRAHANGERCTWKERNETQTAYIATAGRFSEI